MLSVSFLKCLPYHKFKKEWRSYLLTNQIWPCLYVLSVILSEILFLSLLLPIIWTWWCPTRKLVPRHMKSDEGLLGKSKQAFPFGFGEKKDQGTGFSVLAAEKWNESQLSHGLWLSFRNRTRRRLLRNVSPQRVAATSLLVTCTQGAICGRDKRRDLLLQLVAQCRSRPLKLVLSDFQKFYYVQQMLKVFKHACIWIYKSTFQVSFRLILTNPY